MRRAPPGLKPNGARRSGLDHPRFGTHALHERRDMQSSHPARSGQHTHPQDSASPHAAPCWTFQTEPIPEAWTVIDAHLGERVIVRSYEQLGGILSGRTRHAAALKRARQVRELYSGCGFTRKRVMTLVKISSSTFFRYLSTCWDHCRSGFRKKLVPRTTCNSNNNSNSTGNEDESGVSAFLMRGWNGATMGARRFYRLIRHEGYLVDLKTIENVRGWKACAECGLEGSLHPLCLYHALLRESPWLRDDPPPMKPRTAAERAKEIRNNYGLSQQPATGQQVADGRSLVDTIKWRQGGRRRLGGRFDSCSRASSSRGRVAGRGLAGDNSRAQFARRK